MSTRFLFLALLLLPTAAQAQERTPHSITGTVVDAETGAPLPGANAFLDGTTRGTATDRQGRFHLQGVPEGTYKLIVSMVGYQTLNTLITVPNASRKIFRFRPAPVTVALPGVTVRGDRRQWVERLERFKSSFLGNTKNAARARIENPEVLSFEVSEDGDTLRAHASRPLRVVNEALGYEVAYRLRRFALNEEGTFHRNGYGRFREMEPGSVAEQNRWWRARRRAYYGSFMHFVRSLASGSAERQGFRVYRTDRYGRLYTHNGALHLSEALLKQRVHDLQTLYTLRGASNVQLHFGDYNYLLVVYGAEGEERQFIEDYYIRRQGEASGGPKEGLGKQPSWIKATGAPVLLDGRSGLSLSARAPTLLGYWGWSERIAERLPRGYRPGNDLSIAVPTLASSPASNRPPEPDDPAPEATAESARVVASVGQCTAKKTAYRCTLNVQEVLSLRSAGRSLPLRLTVRWPKALWRETAPPSAGHRLRVTLQPSAPAAPSAPRWVIRQVHEGAEEASEPE